MPLTFDTGDLENLTIGAATTDGGALLWSGPLAFPSGTVLLTNQSMRPLARHELRPGTYDVVIRGSHRPATLGALHISFTRAG